MIKRTKGDSGTAHHGQFSQCLHLQLNVEPILDQVSVDFPAGLKSLQSHVKRQLTLEVQPLSRPSTDSPAAESSMRSRMAHLGM